MGFGEGAVEELAMNAGFWRDRRVFITGHTGFKGSWLALWLQRLGANVMGFSSAPATQPNLFDLASVHERMSSRIGDVRDFEALHAAMREHQPEVVLHLAAQSLVRYGYANPRETYEVNVMGTVNLLEAVKDVPGVRSVVIVTTDKCYENNEWIWPYRENDRLGGRDPYSNSKACAELVTAAFRASYLGRTPERDPGVAVASARAGNVIGGGDWAHDRLVPDLMRAIVAREPVVIRNPEAIRPWQHVLEPLCGYLILSEKLFDQGERYASSWNFGPSENDARTVAYVVQRLVDLWGAGASWEGDSQVHPHEATYLKLDSAKARDALMWRPKLRLDDALEWLTDWYRAYVNKHDMRRECLNQIEAYEALGHTADA